MGDDGEKVRRASLTPTDVARRDLKVSPHDRRAKPNGTNLSMIGLGIADFIAANTAFQPILKHRP